MSADQDRSQAWAGISDERRLWLALVEQSARTDALKAEVSAIRSSLSWRITAPLRACRALFAGSVKAGRSGTMTQTAAEPAILVPVGVPPWMAEVRAGESDSRARWLVDVTELAREDLGAGVERVTRRLLEELLLAPPEGTSLQPVRLVAEGFYVGANGFLARFLGLPHGALGQDLAIEPRANDCFVGLDLCRSYAAPLERALRSMRAAGVPVNLLVHDMLPITHPEWFPQGVPQAFESWVRVLASTADRAVCNSHQTARALAGVLQQRGIMSTRLETCVIPLGADFPPSPFASTLPPREHGIARVLTVGTVEPRKGHAQALEAFDILWGQGSDMHWIIAGKAGWNVRSLLDRIRRHREFGRRLHWVEGPDDRALAGLYRECDALLSPSLGEGYGLPVAEAGWVDMPLVLRDMPIYREVAGEGPVYFSGTEPGVLAQALQEWSADKSKGRSDRRRWNTWAQSASELKHICTTSPTSGRTRNEV